MAPKILTDGDREILAELNRDAEERTQVYVFTADISIEANCLEDADDRLNEVVSLVSQDLGIGISIMDQVDVEDRI